MNPATFAPESKEGKTSPEVRSSPECLEPASRQICGSGGGQESGMREGEGKEAKKGSREDERTL